jgi:hypothetical protein
VTWDDLDGSELEQEESDSEMANFYLMEKGDEVCLKSYESPNKWFMDNVCLRHMTGDKSKLSPFIPKDEGFATFGDNSRGKIIGAGNVDNYSSSCIENVLLVDGLKHNLISISQLCDKDYKVIFDKNECIITYALNNQILFIASRHGNVYTFEFDSLVSQDLKCLADINENSWLWHCRLGRTSMDLLHKLNKHDLVQGLPKTKFVKDKICDACQLGKQHKTSFPKKKYISTSRPLQLLHMDLFGSNIVASLGRKLYAFVIVDDFSRFT